MTVWTIEEIVDWSGGVTVHGVFATEAAAQHYYDEHQLSKVERASIEEYEVQE